MREHNREQSAHPKRRTGRTPATSDSDEQGKNIPAAFKSVINAAVRRGLIERNGTIWIRKAR